MTLSNQNVVYDIWLQYVLNFGSSKVNDIMAEYKTSKNVYEAFKENKIKKFSKKEKERAEKYSLEDAEKVVVDCKNKGIGILPYNDNNYPNLLKNIFNPPLLIYYKGKLANFDNEVIISLVGTRSCTKYGANLTLNLGYRLTRCGFTIITGGAYGIDTEALIGSLKSGGSPICVFGGGIDKIYPKENKALFEAIAQRGLILSEYPPLVNPIGRNFPLRNRIISGLSLGVAVIEAPEKSGALITANHSLEQGKDVFSVPGNVGSYVSNGTNELLKEGAIPLTSYKDIVDMYIDKYSDIIHDVPSKIHLKSRTEYNFIDKNNQENKTANKKCKNRHKNNELTNKENKHTITKVKSNISGISDNAQKLYDVLTDIPTNIDELAIKAGISARDAMISLSELQLMDVVESHSGKQYTFK